MNGKRVMKLTLTLALLLLVWPLLSRAMQWLKKKVSGPQGPAGSTGQRG